MLRRLVLFSLGNPGPINRHLAGHHVLKQLSQTEGISLSHRSSTYASGELEKWTLVHLLVFMNELGKALGQYLKEQRLGESALVILYDDFEVDTGRVKIQPMKAKDLHNGLSSCYAKLTNMGVDLDNVFKLGIGIGPKPKRATRNEMALWVLSKFKREELYRIDTTGISMCEDYLSEVGKGMSLAETSRWNKIFVKKHQRGEYEI